MAGSGKPIGNIKLGISLDDTNFGNTLDEINAKVRQAESNMKANMKAYDSAGRTYEALSQKTKDLSKVMDGQSAKVKELTKRRDAAIDQYGAESKQVANLNTQINTATAKYNAYSRQLNSTKKELVYSKTAVNDLTNEIKDNERQMNEEVKVLKSAGDESGAFAAKQKGLTKQADLSKKAMDEQRKVVKLMSDEFGDSADETEDARKELNKLERQSKLSDKQLEGLKSSANNAGREIDDLGNHTERSSRKMDGFKDKIGSLKSSLSFGAVAGVASNLIGRVIDGVSDLKSEAFEASDSLDKFTQTMEFAGIDNKKIKESQTVMKEYADQTVYELGDVMNTTAQLAANGVKDFNGLTQAIGNVNAVSGGNADTFKSVATAMTQTIGAGKLTTENFNQISDAIPGASGKIQEALKEMGAYTNGDFREAMANGEISAEELTKAFMKLGMTDVAKKASSSTKTIEGAVGNLQAGVVNMINEIMGAFGKGNITNVIDEITKGIENLTTRITPAIKNVLKAIKPLQDGFKNLFIVFTEHNDPKKYSQALLDLDKIIPMDFLAKANQRVMQVQNIFKGLFSTGEKQEKALNILKMTGLSDETVDKIRNFTNDIKNLISSIFTDNKADEGMLKRLGLKPEDIAAIKQLIEGLKTYLGGVFTNIQHLLVAGIEVVKGVFNSIAPYITPIISKIGQALGDIGKSLTNFWNQNGKQIIEAIKNFFVFIQPAVKIVASLLMGFIDNIIGMVKGALNVIQGVIKIFTGLFTGDLSKMWEGVKQIFSGAIQFIWNYVQVIFIKNILGGVKGLASGFTGWIKNLWEATKSLFSGGIENVIGAVGRWMGNVLSKVGSLKNGFVNVIKSLWNGVKSFFTEGIGNTWNKITGWVSNIFGKVKNMKTIVHDVISNMWGSIKNTFRNGIDTVFNWFKSLPSKMVDAIKGGKNAIVDAFKSIFNSVLKAIGKPVNGIIHGASWVLEKLGADKLQEWDVPQYATGTPNGGHPGGPMMVNDGRGAETIITPNGQAFIPRGRNVVLSAPKGTHVLTAEETAMLHGSNKPRYQYKKGTNFFGNLWNGVKNVAGNVGNTLKNVVGDVWDFVSDPGALASKVLNGLGVLDGLFKYPLDVGKGILSKATKALTDKITDLFSSGSLDTGMGTNGVYKYLADVAMKVMQKFPGFQITSGYRPGDPYSHGKHNAIDIALPGVTGGSPKYTEAANYAFDNFANKIGYVITNGRVRDRSGQSGTGIHNGWEIWPDGDHFDHVHLNGVRDPQGPLVSGGDNVSGTGVERWRNQVKRALAMNGLPTSSAYVNAWMKQIQTESGGNPSAVGGNDGLADGNAMGLLQTKPGTFAANAFPGYGNIMSGFDNMLAAINYAKKRYGSSMLSVIGQGHGYANGGIVSQHQIAEIAEGNKPEIIIPLDSAKRSRAMQLLSIAQDKLGVKPKNVVSNDTSGNTMEKLVSLMIQQNNLLAKLLAKDTSIQLDGKEIARNTNNHLGSQLNSTLYGIG